MPKNFPFYTSEAHQQIIGLLEAKRPLAILAATTRDEQLAGALYPFPLIEDGDIDIPSAYMTEADGARLAGLAGMTASLEIRASRTTAVGRNVIARKGNQTERIVVMAHIDAKAGTPGALDNAAGVVVILMLAELLADYAGGRGVEIVAMNGEDYYSNPGEQLYLSQNAGRFGEITLAINVDGAGYMRGRSAYSLYDCPPHVTATARQVFGARPDMVEGEAWYQGDHSLFVLNQRPALAITSEHARQLMAEVAHTARDTVDNVDPARLANLALALNDLIRRLAAGEE